MLEIWLQGMFKMTFPTGNSEFPEQKELSFCWQYPIVCFAWLMTLVFFLNIIIIVLYIYIYLLFFVSISTTTSD